MKKFIVFALCTALISVAALTGCSQDTVEALKKYTQDTGNTIEVTETAPDGTVLQHMKVTPRQIEATHTFPQAADTEEATADSGGGNPAFAKLTACTHEGPCTLAKHAADEFDPWLPNPNGAAVRPSRAETNLEPSLMAHAVPSTMSRKESSLPPMNGSLPLRQ